MRASARLKQGARPSPQNTPLALLQVDCVNPGVRGRHCSKVESVSACGARSPPFASCPRTHCSAAVSLRGAELFGGGREQYRARLRAVVGITVRDARSVESLGYAPDARKATFQTVLDAWRCSRSSEERSWRESQSSHIIEHLGSSVVYLRLLYVVEATSKTLRTA